MKRSPVRFGVPPLVIGRRLATDAFVLWIGVRVALAVILAASDTPFPLLPTPRTSAVVVAVVVVLCAAEVRRLRETTFLRNLGVSLAGQLTWSFAAAGAFELVARWLAGSLGAGPP